MRLGLFGDVHANLPALETALAFLGSSGVDAYVCTGDLVGYGPQPNECVARVTALDGTCVAGNHDLIALGELAADRCIPLARHSLRWTRGVLDEDARTALQGLPRQASAPGRVVVAHGSLADSQQYVRTAEEATAQLGAAPEADTVILGHTHSPLAVGERRGMLLAGPEGVVRLLPGERHVLNPGSVGQSRERHAWVRVAVMDLDRSEVTFRGLPYDVHACRAELRRRGLPARSCHLRPRPWRRAGGQLLLAARRLGSASRGP
ncbi:MAG: metallophosphoesterase family protein [Thermoleophilaceae bacterium]